jgi:hypothetical protein
MKKRFKLFTSLIVGAVLFVSCIDDFRFGDNALDKLPGTDMNIDTIFSSPELTRRHLWGLYHYLPNPAPAVSSYDMNGSWYETLSDCQHSVLGWDHVALYWYTGTYNANNDSQSRWGFTRTRCWEGMRMGWIFLENIDRVPGMSDAEKARLKAEAKIIIAAKNWELFRHYGGIPIVDRSYTITDETFKERGTIEETVNHILGLLDDAIAEPNLPWNLPDSELNTWFGRLTKAAAMGQKMLLLLHAASPIFNSAEPYAYPDHPAVVNKLVWWGGYRQELWVQLKETCEAFIRENERNGNYYQLIQPIGNTESHYMQAYRQAYWNRGNREKIYTSIKLFQQGWWDRIWSGQTREGSQSPTAEFMEMFPNADGTPFDTTGVYTYSVSGPVFNANNTRYEYPQGVSNPNPSNRLIFENRDPRLYEVLRVQKRDQRFQASPCELWPGGHTMSWGNGPKYLAHGMGLMKWVLDFQGDATYRAVDHCWPILRMGGFHLIYAEALAETGNLAAACDQVDIVRRRVGLGGIRECNPTLNLTNNKENLINEILRERAIELGYEDTRLMDMVRRKLRTNFTKQLHGVFTYRKDGVVGKDLPTIDLWYDRRPIRGEFTRKWWEPGFWDDKWFLCAFPVNEVNKGWGLIQNPGW